MKNQKGISTLVGIIIIVIIAVVAFGGVFAYQYFSTQKTDNQQQQTENSPNTTQQNNITDQIAGWQTYTNTEYGYEIKHPQDWSIYGSGDKVTIFCDYQSRNYQPCEGLEGLGIGAPGPAIGISISQINFEDYKKNWSVQTQKNFTLDGTNGWKMLAMGGVGWPYNIIFATKNNMSYIISFPEFESVSVLNQILSTFKFTN